MKRLKYSRISIASFTATVLLGSALIFSPVKAYFHKTAEQEMDIQMGTWWDGSRLAFTDSSQSREDACSPVRITFTVENTGFAMIGPSSFRVFKDGERIEAGSLGEISANGKGAISVTVQSPGTYYAEADQRPGYEGSAAPVSTSSGNAAIAECPPPPKEEKEKKKKDSAGNKGAKESKTKDHDKQSDQAASTETVKAEENADAEKSADAEHKNIEKAVSTEEKER